MLLSVLVSGHITDSITGGSIAEHWVGSVMLVSLEQRDESRH